MKHIRYSLSTALLIGHAAQRTTAFVAATGRVGAGTETTRAHLFNKLFSSATTDSKYPVMADEDVMRPKAHGTSEKPVQKNLRWGCDYETADRICNFK